MWRAIICPVDVHYLFRHYKPLLQDAPTVICEIVVDIYPITASLQRWPYFGGHAPAFYRGGAKNNGL